MNDFESRNPDYLLSVIKKDEGRDREGKLKIFLGMVAGVGKTYAMLQAAHQAKRSGLDVVVGIVETHGRSDTADLLTGLDVMPRAISQYKGVNVDELDLDGILKRHPDMVVVDELAHSNAVGSRHAKRYQDVLELLKAGIDVYSTLNVQHIESRVDTVQEITKIVVHETVPDSVLDRADEVILIDLPPEDLLRRLREGRIYAPDSAQLAAKNFFKQGNLTALREIALRIAAERVDRDLREYKTLHGIDGVWKAGGRLMVAIFASPYSEVLIRWTRRIADLLGVTWIGAYVESDEERTDEEKRLLAKNIALAQQIGGEVIATRDDDPVKGLLRIAQQNNVTQIIVGKSQRGIWQNLMTGGSILDRLIRSSGNIDIYAVATSRAKGRQNLRRAFRPRKALIRSEEFVRIFAVVVVAFGIGEMIEPITGYMAVGIVFLLAVSISGLFLRRTAVMFLAAIFALMHDYFFIPPKYTFIVSRIEDFMILLMMFVSASVMGHLTTRLASKERILREREERTNLLYNLAKEIASAQSFQSILSIAQHHLASGLGMNVYLFLPKHEGRPTELEFKDHLPDSEKEKAVATWTFENGKIAGHGTETLNAAQHTYVPIVGRTGVLGVACFATAGAKEQLTLDQLTLVEALLHQVASGIERETYHDRVKALTVMAETQKLYKSLLDCVSHELKTPLATIKGAASAILDPVHRGNLAVVESLSTQILEASDRLQRLVENLLDMTRIESGQMQPKSNICDVNDLVSTALAGLRDIRKGRTVEVTMENELPPVVCDHVLVHQALMNILHNAYIYTPELSKIEIKAKSKGDRMVEISIRDHGPGLPLDYPDRVMEKFYRVNQNQSGGVGLGLSIAKGFIEAQGGTLTAANHVGGGAVFTIILPVGATSA